MLVARPLSRRGWERAACISTRCETLPRTISASRLRPRAPMRNSIGLDGFCGIENDLAWIADFIDLCHFTAGRKHAGGMVKNLASRVR